MPDQLEVIVQRMLEAGESEENIATVIQSAPQAAPRQATPPPAQATAGMMPQSTAAGDPMQPGAQKIHDALSWTGKMLGGAFMGPAGARAVESPTATLAGAAVPGLGRAVAPFAKPAAQGVARVAGSGLTELGRSQIMSLGGALGGGVPGMIAGSLARPAMRSAGRALTRFGAKPTGTPTLGPLASAQPIAPAASAEGTQVEQLYRALARKAIRTPAEEQQFQQLAKIVGPRASQVGLSFASGGKTGIP